MLSKIELPIDKLIAEKLLNPVLSEFIRVYICDWNIPLKVWMVSTSYVVCVDKTGLTSIHNLHNKRSKVVKDLDMMFSSDVGNLVVYRKIDTFQQNDLRIISPLYKYVCSRLVTTVNQGANQGSQNILYGIGGEFYLYFLFCKDYYSQFHGISNSVDIIGVAQKNLTNYFSLCNGINPIDNYTLQHVKYDRMQLINLDRSKKNSLIINLSTVPLNVLNEVVRLGFDRVVIVTCNQQVFNRRRSILETEKYKLIGFEHFQSVSLVYVSVYVYLIRP